MNAIQANPSLLAEQPLELRNALLDFIADFANWDNSTDKDYLETSRALVQARSLRWTRRSCWSRRGWRDCL